MKIFFAAAILALAGGAVLAGTITGTVRAEPKTGTEPNSGGANNNYEKREYKFVPRVDYAAMHDFVVFIEGQAGTNAAPTNVVRVTTTKVAQQKATFLPHVLPVMIGTKVEWPNNDDIYHNVFSVSDAHSFDLGFYKGNPKEKAQTFDRAGKVDVYCSIHANMHCIVLVLENPYFAATDSAGHFTITNVPPGRYKLKAWHERLPADEREITVPATGETNVDFTLTIKNLPQY